MNNENGRSMVEMLGVLAIAGLISIMGVAGFNTAMQRVRANTIAEFISDMFVEAKTYRGANKCIDLDYLDDDVKIPSCIKKLKVSTIRDIAKITFNEDCTKIEQLVGASFGECRWKNTDSHTYLIAPSVGRQGAGCDDMPNWEC